MSGRGFRDYFRFKRPVATLTIVALLILVALALLDLARTLSGLKLAAFFTLWIPLGAGVVASIGLLTRARWMEPIYESLRLLMSLMPVLAALTLLVLGVSAWVEGSGEYPEGSFAQLWMKPEFLLGRSLLLLSVWAVLLGRIRRGLGSGEHSTQGGREDSIRSGVVFLVVFGMTWWLSCLDWLMPQGTTWVSTGFWVYALAGLLLEAFAIVTVVILLKGEGTDLGNGTREGTREGTDLETKGATLLRAENSRSVYHDLGKILLALSCFWAYLWFSQVMLVWYSHLPAETGYFIARANTDWKGLFYSNVLLNWAIPALVLLPRRTKINRFSLLYAAAVVLIGRWVDLLLMLFPDRFSFGPWFGTMGLLATFCFVALFALSQRTLHR